MLIRITLLTVIWLTACTPYQLQSPGLTQTTSHLPDKKQPTGVPTQERFSTITPHLSTPTAPDLQTLIEKVKEDLAQRLTTSTPQIELIKVIEVVWPDSSLGCPQPEMTYTQVLTDGFIIQLKASEILYRYHTNTTGQIILCERPRLPVLPVTPGEIDDGEPWMPVN